MSGTSDVEGTSERLIVQSVKVSKSCMYVDICLSRGTNIQNTNVRGEGGLCMFSGYVVHAQERLYELVGLQSGLRSPKKNLK